AEAATQAQLAEYERKLAAYNSAYGAYKKKNERYWAEIKRKRDLRRKLRREGKTIKKKHFVLSQPPKYEGPKKPRHPDFKLTKKPRRKSTLPNANQLRKAVKDLYDFTPRGGSEKDFKLAFAREAQRYGLSSEQIVGVYALETGGKGPFDLVSGEAITRNNKCKMTKRVGRPLSTAIGYFQLLNANTSSTLAGNFRGPKDERYSTRLRALADREGGKRERELRQKAKLLERMVKDMDKAISRMDVRKNNWREFRALGKTKLGRAVHALNLDLDIGPMIQMTKLAIVRDYAVRKNIKNLTSERLELMNLVGYPRGALMLAPVASDVPTANFVSEREIRANRRVLGDKTVAQSIARIKRVIDLRKKECGSEEFFRAFRQAT
ncbi:MAG: hypothetical protein AAGE89_16315, partial [Pseudomonadota bacterium]